MSSVKREKPMTASSSAKLMELPRLAQWPEEAFEHEPAHGFFIRLAVLNKQFSPGGLANSFGMNGRDFNCEELLPFVLEFPFRFPERVIDATPRVHGTQVILNGQSFNWTKDWSLARPRLCPACLAEKLYYRNWFDLKVLDYCPFHAVPLVTVTAPSALMGWFAGGGPEVAAAGDSMPVKDARSSAAWSAYVLGRLGVGPRVQSPLLDGSTMAEAIESLEVVGDAVEYGWGMKLPAPQTRYRSPGLLARGFAVVNGGEEALRSALQEYTRSALSRAGAATLEHGIRSFFGYLYWRSRQIHDSPISRIVRAAMHQVGREAGVYSLKGPRWHDTKDAPVTLKVAARRLGIQYARLRRVATKMGLIAKIGREGTHAFSGAMIEEIKATLADLVSRKEASDLLGLSGAEFAKLWQAGVFQPFIEPKHRWACRTQFRRSEIEKFLCDIKLKVGPSTSSSPQTEVPLLAYAKECELAPSEVVMKILAGEVIPTGWDHTSMGLKGCLLCFSGHEAKPKLPGDYKPRLRVATYGWSLSEVASFLRVSSKTVAALEAAGYLPVAKRTGPVQTFRFSEQSVRKFAKRYASAALYARSLQCYPAYAMSKLTSLGVSRVPVQGTALVDRAKARSVLGLSYDPDNVRATTTAAFWYAFEQYLRKVRSTTRVTILDHGRARLWNGRRLAIAEFAIDQDGRSLAFRVSSDPARSRRRFALVRSFLKEISESWPELECQVDEATGAVTMKYELTFELSNTAGWELAFSWIEDKMTRLRAILAMDRSKRLKSDPADIQAHTER